MASLTEMSDGRFDPHRTARCVFEDVSRKHPQITLEESQGVVLDLAKGATVTIFIGLLTGKILKDRAQAQQNTQPTDSSIATSSRV